MEQVKEPLISVIVPIYAVEQYLRQCLDSIINQSYKNLEIILVDDGSPDSCPQIIDDYAKKDDRIVTIHKPNGGLSSARNAGIEVMKGDYVVFIDSDDWIESEYVECLYRAISKYDACISVVGFKRVNANTEKCSKFLINSEITYYACPTEQAVKYFFETAIAVWGKMYRCDKVEDLRFIEGRLAEDVPYQMDVLKKISCVAFCNKHLYNYRIREGSIAHTIKPKYLMDYILSVYTGYQACLTSFYSEITFSKSWLSSLLYELLAADAYGKQEKILYETTIKSIIDELGGRKALISNCVDPCDIICYTRTIMDEFLTCEEKKSLQADFRIAYSLRKEQHVGLKRRLKHYGAYININFIEKLMHH